MKTVSLATLEKRLILKNFLYVCSSRTFAIFYGFQASGDMWCTSGALEMNGVRRTSCVGVYESCPVCTSGESVADE